MPVTDMRFEDGIFYAREHGRLDETDAATWRDYLKDCTLQSQQPVVALIDALEVTFINPGARRIFLQSSNMPNYHVAAVAASTETVVTSRVIGMLAKSGHTYVFKTMHEARQFAEEQARLLQEQGKD